MVGWLAGWLRLAWLPFLLSLSPSSWHVHDTGGSGGKKKKREKKRRLWKQGRRWRRRRRKRGGETVLRKADTRGGWERCRSMPASQPASQPTDPTLPSLLLFSSLTLYPLFSTPTSADSPGDKTRTAPRATPAYPFLPPPPLARSSLPLVHPRIFLPLLSSVPSSLVHFFSFFSSSSSSNSSSSSSTLSLPFSLRIFAWYTRGQGPTPMRNNRQGDREGGRGRTRDRN